MICISNMFIATILGIPWIKISPGVRHSPWYMCWWLKSPYELYTRPSHINVPPFTDHSWFYSQTKLPFAFTLAFIPPLGSFFFEENCSSIFTFSSSLMCFARVASRSASADALAAFWASRLAAFWRWRLDCSVEDCGWGPVWVWVNKCRVGSEGT